MAIKGVIYSVIVVILVELPAVTITSSGRFLEGSGFVPLTEPKTHKYAFGALQSVLC